MNAELTLRACPAMYSPRGQACFVRSQDRHQEVLALMKKGAPKGDLYPAIGRERQGEQTSSAQIVSQSPHVHYCCEV